MRSILLTLSMTLVRTPLVLPCSVTVALLCCLGVGCDKKDPTSTPQIPSSKAAVDSAPWFEEVAKANGLDFTWQSGHNEDFLLPEIIGGGVAVFDMEGDGDLDVYFVQGGNLREGGTQSIGNALFQNDGHGKFQNVTADSGASDTGYGMGVATGDYDQDGDTDLYVSNLGPNVLLNNDGTGHFTDVTAQAQVGHPGWGTGATFFDADNDGDLDLFQANYLNWTVESERVCFNAAGAVDFCLPAEYNAPAIDTLYLNLGDGTFADVTSAAGIHVKPGTGLGVVAADINRDGLIDLAVANDGLPDRLWMNMGNAHFKDVAMQLGTALDEEGKAKAGMGIDIKDIDADGDLDLLIGNLGGESDSLFFNEGDYFIDATGKTGLRPLTRPYTRFGLGLFDFNNDGLLDLYEANGTVTATPDSLTDDVYAEPNMLLAGDGKRFKPVMPIGGTAEPIRATSRGAAFGDLDNDGGIDVIVVNRDAPVSLLHNQVAKRGNWIDLIIIDHNGAPALGAQVLASSGLGQQLISVRTDGSYLAANTPITHLGLGEETVLREVQIRWQDGSQATFGPLKANQVHRFRPPEAPGDQNK